MMLAEVSVPNGCHKKTSVSVSVSHGGCENQTIFKILKSFYTAIDDIGTFR